MSIHHRTTGPYTYNDFLYGLFHGYGDLEKGPWTRFPICYADNVVKVRNPRILERDYGFNHLFNYVLKRIEEVNSNV